MEWLNYHHLLYFWVVAREGGLGPASRELRLAPPTLSGQIRLLEESLGEKLFEHSGRRLRLTDIGTEVYRYANEIFSLGGELLATLRGRTTERVRRLRVGVVDVMPKILVRHLLEPALHLPEPVQLVCYEDSYERLLAELALHALDVVLADQPPPPNSAVRVYSHLLGESGVTFFGAGCHAKLRRGFPGSLDGAPMLLPLPGSPMRRALEQWFASHAVRPRLVGEFEDSALLKVFGADGLGVFASTSVVDAQVRKQYEVSVIGHAPEIKERFYAISMERRLKHAAVIAISEAARSDLFAGRKRRT